MNKLFILFSVLIVFIASLYEFVGVKDSFLLYAIELFFTGICLVYIIQHHKNTSVLRWGVAFSLLLICSYLINSEFGYVEIIKLICYFIIFYAGYCANFRKKIEFKYGRKKLHYYLSVIILLPILLNIYQRFKGELPTSIFINSNNYVLYGYAVGFLFYVITRNKKYSLSILLIYILTGSTLGALLALLLSSLYILKDHLLFKYLILSLVGFFILLCAVLFLDFPIFVRIRDTFNIAVGVFSDSSIKDIVDYDFTTAMAYGEDAANTSFLFRFKHWYNIIEMIGNSSFVELCFGHGDFSLFELSEARLPAHNDYLMILFDFGLIVLLLILKYIITITKALKNDFIFIFVLSVFIYSITENLYTNFIACQIFYYMLGASYSVNIYRKKSLRAVRDIV